MQAALGVLLEHKVDLIVHCGDWVAPFSVEFLSKNSGDIPVKGVFGNNEGDIKSIMARNAKLAKPVAFAERKVLDFQAENRRLACVHGEDAPTLDALISSKKYDAVFTGHTHLPRNEVIDGVLVFNPGSTCFECDGEIVDDATVGIYDTQTNTGVTVKV